MTDWKVDQKLYGEAGIFVVLAKAGTSAVTSVTYIRGAMTQVEQFTYADPFADATAVIRFPSVTAWDGPTGDTWWLREWTNLDIYWVPATAEQWPNGGNQLVLNPLTGEKNWYLHHLNEDGSYILPLWEGFIVGMEPTDEGMRVQCQGFMYQLDRYVAKPFYSVKPWPHERLIEREFHQHHRLRKDPRRNLLVKELRYESNIVWPAGWERKARRRDVEPYSSPLTPDKLEVDQNWSGYFTRNTGSFEPALTGYVQALLGMMYVSSEDVDEAHQDLVGAQWTIDKQPGPRRQPRLIVRDQNRTPDFYVWYGQPGVEARFTKDALNTTNIVFGQGQGYDGTQWRGTEEIGVSAEVIWKPLANSADWPYHRPTPGVLVNQFSSERYENYTQGVPQDQAERVAQLWVNRDSDPGWTGTMELLVDPLTLADQPLLKWRIRAGMVVLVRGFAGSGTTGVRFHIAEVTCEPVSGRVTLRLDTKFRDLLTVEEVQAQTRDPLTPVKALQINRRSNMIEDILAPWDYTKGSGFVPKGALDFFQQKKAKVLFPYDKGASSTKTTDSPNRPRDQFKSAYRANGSGDGPINFRSNGAKRNNYPDTWADEDVPPFYLPVNVGNSDPNKRWSSTLVRTAQAGEIEKVQFCAYDEDGEVLRIRYHVSIYNYQQFLTDMPKNPEDGKRTPFFPYAFESLRPDGLPWTGPDAFHSPPEALIVGWGNWENPAGYSPGRLSDGSGLSGLLVDSSPWPFNNVSDETGKIQADIPIGGTPEESSLDLCVVIYADTETSEYNGNWAYFMGRLFKKVQGAN